MKTTSILKYAMVVLVIAFSFNACIEPADNPEETPESIPTAVIVTTTITEDLARFSNVQLFENGVAVKTFNLVSNIFFCRKKKNRYGIFFFA